MAELIQTFYALGFFTSFCLGMPCKHISPPQRHVCWESCDIISCGDPHVVLACVCVLIQTIAGHTWAPDNDQRTTKIREACRYVVNTVAPMKLWIELKGWFPEMDVIFFSRHWYMPRETPKKLFLCSPKQWLPKMYLLKGNSTQSI